MVTIAARRRTKFLFLGLSIFLIAAFIVVTQVYSDKGYTDLPELKHENHALNPHFQSKDNKGQPYKVDAVKGYLMDDGEVFLLKEPSFSLKLSNGNVVTVTAEKGFLHQEQSNLKLQGSVVVSYGDQVRFRMPFTEIDLETSEIKGDKSILGGSEKLSLQAGSFHIEEKGAKITLTDKPVLRFNVQK